jgi:hypothetical protein
MYDNLYVYSQLFLFFKGMTPMLWIFFQNCVINHFYSSVTNIVKEIWCWEKNGYIDYLINYSSNDQFLSI